MRIKETRDLLDEYGIRLTKSLGQNFLVDENVVEHIVDGAGVTKDDLVIEIGAGAGHMTKLLADTAGYVIALEIDSKLIPLIKGNLSAYGNCKVIHGDALKADFHDIVHHQLPGDKQHLAGNVKVVANLPYYITTPLIMKLLEENDIVKSMTLMMQREVADRMCALPGKKDYGALTLAINYYSVPQKLFDVPPSCFFPRPEVYSTVIHLQRQSKPGVDVKSREMLFKVIKASFGQRRKTLQNGLFNSGVFGKTKQEIADCITACGIDPGCRGETLTLAEFGKLSDKLS